MLEGDEQILDASRLATGHGAHCRFADHDRCLDALVPEQPNGGGEDHAELVEPMVIVAVNADQIDILCPWPVRPWRRSRFALGRRLPHEFDETGCRPS